MPDLLRILRRAATAADTIGAEVELLVVEPTTGRPAGAHQISQALRGHEDRISFEAPGQVEVRTPAAGSVRALAPMLADAVNHAVARLADAGLAALALGFQPLASLRSRHGADAQVASADELVLSSAAAVHVSISYRDEEDARRKLVAGRVLAPDLVALFGGSPLAKGRPLAVSIRAATWASAFAEYRIPGLVLAPEPGMFDRYVAWLLKRPAQAGSAPLERLRIPTADVRLKGVVEVRSFDSVPVAGAIAAAAMVRGLLTDTANLAQLAAHPVPVAAHEAALARAARVGLADKDLADRVGGLVDLAAHGLERLGDDPSTLVWARDAVAARQNWGQRITQLWSACASSPRQFVATLTSAMAGGLTAPW